MRSRLVILAALVLAAASQAAPALANDAATCTNAADISWEVDRSDHRVRTIIVEVDGCDGGELVGIQLITEDGDVPPSAPLVGEAWEGTATFDLMDTGLYVAPITGVRVFLELSGGEQVTWQITVDRRFFSSQAANRWGCDSSPSSTCPSVARTSSPVHRTGTPRCSATRSATNPKTSSVKAPAPSMSSEPRDATSRASSRTPDAWRTASRPWRTRVGAADRHPTR
jgi:hypothetical protein